MTLDSDDIAPTPDPTTPEDADTLARTLYGEARGEGKIGMQAVGNVVMNRVALSSQHGHFGDGTIAGACLVPYQFSCWNEYDPNQKTIESVMQDDPVFAQARSIAMAIISGLLPDITGGATYYEVMGTEAKWSDNQTPCCVIGRHAFYKDIS